MPAASTWKMPARARGRFGIGDRSSIPQARMIRSSGSETKRIAAPNSSRILACSASLSDATATSSTPFLRNSSDRRANSPSSRTQ